MTIQEIQQAIRQLSRFQRENLAEWILNSADFADHIAEAAPTYGELLEPVPLSVDEYLRRELECPIRNEYVAGLAFPMADSTTRHALIANEVRKRFSNHLGGGPLRVFSDSMKLRLQLDQDVTFYYPDVMVAPGAQDVAGHYLENPRLIVEVLAPSTSTIDRREKAFTYRQIDSLEEYAWIAQGSQKLKIYRRSDNWAPLVLTAPDAVVEFRSIGLSVTLEEIYKEAQGS